MFSLPLHSFHRPTQIRNNANRSRKRKRQGSYTSEQERGQDALLPDSYTGSPGTLSSSRRSAVTAVLTPDEIYQYAVAGQPVEDALQGHPFPHTDSTNRWRPSRFDYDLRQELKAAHASHSERDGSLAVQSLHQQHLAVMTTILHRSLLEQDFVRAGRALGMILRDEVGGRPVDVRAECRWGIGAEILLRQDAQKQQRGQEQSSPSSPEQYTGSEGPRAWFSRKGFEEAKRYYERLIVQYPFYKQNPGAVNALDFYPAMFGLWIYVVHQEAKLKSSKPKSGLNDSDDNQVILEELSQAKEIADRMESVMSAPPYREDADLIDLSRNVHIWIHDLEEASAAHTDEIDAISQGEDASMESLTSGVTKVSLQGQT